MRIGEPPMAEVVGGGGNRVRGEDASYEKHKIFLYREDFTKFLEGLQSAISFIVDSKGEVVARIEEGEEA